MKTSQQWWDEVRVDEAKLNDWLVRQFRGEISAFVRITKFAEEFATEDPVANRILRTIAGQEQQHATWVLDLLRSRDIDPSVDNAEDRYWSKTLPAIKSFETGAAIGAHAEKMRLGRIKVIAADETAPNDVRQVFQRILKDELWHEEAFRRLAGPKAMADTAHSHEAGMELLGLEA
jgi:rubrerythrin